MNGKCKCGVDFTLDNSAETVFERKRGFCLACTKVYNQSYYLENSEKIKSEARKYRCGVTSEEFDAAIINQNGLCMICNQPMVRGNQGSFRACQDHCHVTGKVRDVLCSRCNTLLGCCSDNPGILVSAIQYLWRHADGATEERLC
jgi:hypothetical protein